jgi:hypothetical protein
VGRVLPDLDEAKAEVLCDQHAEQATTRLHSHDHGGPLVFELGG